MRRERTTEIHSILSVTSSANAEEEVTHYVPFYSYRHNWDSDEPHAFWYARRTPTGRDDVPGTDMHLTFLDLNAQPTEPPLQTIYAHTLCTNRNLAVHLPAGARLQIEESAPLLGISCLTKPTTAIPPSLGGASQWKIISQLSLNHLSLSDGPESLQALREILRLSSMSERHSAQQQISGIREMTTRPIVRLIGQDAWKGMCKGIEISLMLDEEFYVGSSAFLFSAVLQRFFAMYASVNSFTQLVVHSSKREGIWKRWPPMAGEQTVL
jgi:type VI secretion system protein ImpG